MGALVSRVNTARITMRPRVRAARRALAGRSPFGDYLVDPVPRWGYGRPPHPILTQIIRRQRERYGAHR